MVPRFTLQGEYRIELWKFNEKLCWEGDICCSVIVEKVVCDGYCVLDCDGEYVAAVADNYSLAETIDYHVY